MNIPRHSYKVLTEGGFRNLKRMEKKLPLYLEKLQNDPGSISYKSVHDNLLAAVSENQFLNRSMQEGYKFLFYALQFGINHFKLALTTEEVELQIGNKKVKAKGHGKLNEINSGSWKVLRLLAAILRDQEAIAFLNSIEEDQLKYAQLTMDTFDVSEFHFYKNLNESSLALAKTQSQSPESVQTAFVARRDYEKGVNKDRIKFTQAVHLPALELYQYIFEKAEEKFNQELEKAILKHKEHYSKKNKVGDRWGWIAWHILAACAYAHDHGIRVKVESDYTPKWLAEGDFEGLSAEV